MAHVTKHHFRETALALAQPDRCLLTRGPGVIAWIFYPVETVSIYYYEVCQFIYHFEHVRQVAKLNDNVAKLITI